MRVDGELTQAQSRFFRTQKSHEELYDLEQDPHETVNLAWMPEHADQLAKMRSALENWQDEIVDLGFVPEPILMEQMRPDDKMQTVAEPKIDFEMQGGEMVMALSSDTAGASLQYRNRLTGARDREWKIYSRPVKVGLGDKIEAIACRAGFKSSKSVMKNAPND
jgi:hypothetical protein